MLDEALGASASGEGVDADAGLVGVVVVACESVDTARVLKVFQVARTRYFYHLAIRDLITAPRAIYALAVRKKSTR